MTKLESLRNLLPHRSRSSGLTAANTIHQSSHPTLLTSQIRVTKRKAMRIITTLRASIDVASNPPDRSALPIGGGVVGFSIVEALNPRTQRYRWWKVGERIPSQQRLECTSENSICTQAEVGRKEGRKDEETERKKLLLVRLRMCLLYDIPSFYPVTLWWRCASSAITVHMMFIGMEGKRPTVVPRSHLKFEGNRIFYAV